MIITRRREMRKAIVELLLPVSSILPLLAALLLLPKPLNWIATPFIWVGTWLCLGWIADKIAER